MRRSLTILSVLLATTLLGMPVALAKGDLSQQKPIQMRVDLGKDGDSTHRFHPDTLKFETGKLYKLVIHNPSNSKHYFTSQSFASKIFTRKVQVMDDLGAGAKTIAEIKGPVQEVEVYPGGTTEWWFVPVAAGTIKDLHCSIKDQDGKSHASKGMMGTIVIN